MKTTMTKSKVLLIVLVVVAILGISLYSFFKNNYNTMATASEAVASQWSQVENQYQRRSDLIPNLVATVKGYAEHESSTLESVVEARAKATSTNISFENLNEESLAKFNAAQGELSSALSRLMAISESYPNLKANENFIALQTQLEGTENRISTERMRFNEAVNKYNTMIRLFPKNIVAGMFGFTPKAYFQAEEGSEKPVKVEF